MCIAVAIAGVAGAVISADASKSAADTQANAQMQAAQIGKDEMATITKQEQPFMQAGYGATSKLTDLMGTSGNKSAAGYGSLLDPFTIDKFHEMSPAYQFQMQQGQQGTLNAGNSSLGALSGAAQKDLISYNQNYANTAFNNAFNQYQTQQGNIYNRLSNLAQLGQNAAANTGQQGTQLAGNIGQSVASAGAAQAAGQIGAANAYSSGLQSAALPWLMGGGGGGGAGAGAAFAASNPIPAAPASVDTMFTQFSDRRLKMDVQRVATSKSGLGIYRFKYLWDTDRVLPRVGYMSDEVRRIFPEAVSTDAHGYDLVNYAACGDPAELAGY
jgi:hypothetical protein